MELFGALQADIRFSSSIAHVCELAQQKHDDKALHGAIAYAHEALERPKEPGAPQ